MDGKESEPTALHLWRSSCGGEIDFLAGPRSQIDLVEVKYRGRVDRRALGGVRAAFPSRPAVVCTRSDLDVSGGVALLPAPLLAWALG